MRNKGVDKRDDTLKYVPYHFKTKEMRNKGVDEYSDTLQYVPEHLKAKKCFTKRLIKMVRV